MRQNTLTLPATALVVAVISMLAGACGPSNTNADTSVAAAPAPDTTPPAQTATITDAQIAHIVVTADAVDSTAGVLARTKGSSSAVKDFGRMMAADHGAVNQQAVALATKLGVTPEDNDVSKQLARGGAANMEKLRGLTGAAFDKAYIDNEVAYHQAVADAMDQTLIPGAQNAELKKLLETVRPAFGAHLAKAKQIQASLAR